MKLQDLMNELKKKGMGDQVEELVDKFGLKGLLKARTCFDRLYNDAMDRVHRMEKLKEKYAKEAHQKKYGLQLPGKEELLQAMENSNIEEQVQIEEKKIANEKTLANEKPQLLKAADNGTVSRLTPSLPQIAQPQIAPPAPPPKTIPFKPTEPTPRQQQNFPWGNAGGRSQSLDCPNFRVRRGPKIPETPSMLPAIAPSRGTSNANV
jgi:hypothetical protein